jgi:hypothetical protein
LALTCSLLYTSRAVQEATRVSRQQRWAYRPAWWAWCLPCSAREASSDLSLGSLIHLLCLICLPHVCFLIKNEHHTAITKTKVCGFCFSRNNFSSQVLEDEIFHHWWNWTEVQNKLNKLNTQL